MRSPSPVVIRLQRQLYINTILHPAVCTVYRNAAHYSTTIILGVVAVRIRDEITFGNSHRSHGSHGILMGMGITMLVLWE